MHNDHINREINHFECALTNKNALLKAVDEPMINLKATDNLQQLKHFLKAVATDCSIVMENCDLPDSWTKNQFFQVLCEEVMAKATKLINVDKIFMTKSSEGSVQVINATKLCLYWKTVNEFVSAWYWRRFRIRLYEGNMFGSIMAFIRRCKDLHEICQANGQLFSAFPSERSTLASSSITASQATGSGVGIPGATSGSVTFTGTGGPGTAGGSGPGGSGSGTLTGTGSKPGTATGTGTSGSGLPPDTSAASATTTAGTSSYSKTGHISIIYQEYSKLLNHISQVMLIHQTGSD